VKGEFKAHLRVKANAGTQPPTISSTIQEISGPLSSSLMPPQLPEAQGEISSLPPSLLPRVYSHCKHLGTQRPLLQELSVTLHAQ